MRPPIAKQMPHSMSIHGHTRVDNYFWMNDRDNPEVIDYLNKENEFTKEVLKDQDYLKTEIFEEIVGRIKQDDQSVPYFLDGYSYYSRFEKGSEYPIYCRKKGETFDNSISADEEILLNVNELAEGKDYFEIGSLSVSPDNNKIAYSYDDVSRRLYKVCLLDLSSREHTDLGIENTSGGITWSADGNYLFYSNKDAETLRPFQIVRFSLEQRERAIIFEETDDTFVCDIYKTKSRDYLVISSQSTLTTECQILPSEDATGDFKVFKPRERGVEYSIDHDGNDFFIHHNINAQNFMLSKASSHSEDWQTVIEHRDEVLLENIELYNDKIVIEERIEGLIKFRVISAEKDFYIEFPDEAYTAYLSTNLNLGSGKLRYGYSSLVKPSSVYEYDFISQEHTLLKQQEVVGGYEEQNYISERKLIEVRDGETVPVSIVYNKEVDLQKAPLLLYAYGSYGYSIDAYFSVARLSLLDRGFVYAIAHIRGGEEKGRNWYESGKLLNKLNTFYDFIDCAKALINLGYCHPDKLSAMGGSAGGMLMGGVINMEPKLFKSVVAAVPFVDCVTTMLDDTIPLTTGEYDEWGNPNQKEYYEYMLKYSPYDNIEDLQYPNLLITSGLHDSQVQYWEPTKWIAKIRQTSTTKNTLLLYTNMEAGHGGASGRFEIYKETALEYVFLMKYGQ